jgi:hypothetical protein
MTVSTSKRCGRKRAMPMEMGMRVKQSITVVEA